MWAGRTSPDSATVVTSVPGRVQPVPSRDQGAELGPGHRLRAGHVEQPGIGGTGEGQQGGGQVPDADRAPGLVGEQRAGAGPASRSRQKLTCWLVSSPTIIDVRTSTANGSTARTAVSAAALAAP